MKQANKTQPIPRGKRNKTIVLTNEELQLIGIALRLWKRTQGEKAIIRQIEIVELKVMQVESL